jgi:tetratricopeptide (TPR) repeat protein
MWPQFFDGRDYVDRLVCSSSESPTWKRAAKKGLLETYELDCPGEPQKQLELDVGTEPPPPPPPTMRQLEPKPFAKYREALFALQRKDYDAAMSSLKAAEGMAPEEPIYRREQVYTLYSQGKMSDAFLRADELSKRAPSPLVFKYRALTARELGLQSEVVASLEGIIQASTSRAPLYAEAVCAKGMILLRAGAPEADKLVEEGCALEYKACCDTIAARNAAREEARQRAEQAAEAARKLQVPISTPKAEPETTATPEAEEKPMEPVP